MAKRRKHQFQKRKKRPKADIPKQPTIEKREENMEWLRVSRETLQNQRQQSKTLSGIDQQTYRSESENLSADDLENIMKDEESDDSTSGKTTETEHNGPKTDSESELKSPTDVSEISEMSSDDVKKTRQRKKSEKRTRKKQPKAGKRKQKTSFKSDQQTYQSEPENLSADDLENRMKDDESDDSTSAKTTETEHKGPKTDSESELKSPTDVSEISEMSSDDVKKTRQRKKSEKSNREKQPKAGKRKQKTSFKSDQQTYQSEPENLSADDLENRMKDEESDDSTSAKTTETEHKGPKTDSETELKSPTDVSEISEMSSDDVKKTRQRKKSEKRTRKKQPKAGKRKQKTSFKSDQQTYQSEPENLSADDLENRMKDDESDDSTSAKTTETEHKGPKTDSESELKSPTDVSEISEMSSDDVKKTRQRKKSEKSNREKQPKAGKRKQKTSFKSDQQTYQSEPENLSADDLENRMKDEESDDSTSAKTTETEHKGPKTDSESELKSPTDVSEISEMSSDDIKKPRQRKKSEKRTRKKQPKAGKRKQKTSFKSDQQTYQSEPENLSADDLENRMKDDESDDSTSAKTTETEHNGPKTDSESELKSPTDVSEISEMSSDDVKKARQRKKSEKSNREKQPKAGKRKQKTSFKSDQQTYRSESENLSADDLENRMKDDSFDDSTSDKTTETEHKGPKTDSDKKWSRHKKPQKTSKADSQRPRQENVNSSDDDFQDEMKWKSSNKKADKKPSNTRHKKPTTGFESDNGRSRSESVSTDDESKKKMKGEKSQNSSTKDITDESSTNDTFESKLPKKQRQSKSKRAEKTFRDQDNEFDTESTSTSGEKYMYFNPEGKLSFYLSQEEWMKCKPKKGEQKLRQGWSDIMAEHLKKIIPSCSFSFKHHYLSKKCGYPYFKQYFTATAKCKVPGCAEFKLSMKKPIESQPTKVSVQVSKQIIHPESFKHKRQLRREKRRQAQRDMASKKPSEFFYEKVADLNVEELVFGNQTSCQSRSVLKNAAYEYNLQNVVHSDPITELIIIKHAIKDIDFTSSEVKGYIHATNLDPFSASLYTEEQLKLTKEHFKHGSSVLYLDATGSVIQKRPGSKKAIFYYALVLKGETDSPPLPVMEWVSEDHTVPKITSALLNFNYDLNKVGCKKNPRRVEIDFSWALIHSVLKVYSEKNIATYLEDTFKLLVMEEACPKFTIIHICAAHMIKNIRTSLGKVTDDKRLAELLTRCFAYIQNRTSMKAVRRMWELMLKVFMPSKKDTTAVKQLKETLSGTEVEETLEDGHYPQDDLPDTKEQTIRKKSPFYKLFKINMEQHSDEKESSSVDNNYRAVKAMYMLLNDYLPLIPLWSGLLFPFTGEKITRDSNSAVENWFRIVKKDIVQGKTKLRVGQFVLSLYKSLKGRVKARVFNFDIPAKRKTSKNDEENFMGASEKWGPKTPKKTKQRPKYFEKTSNLPSPKRQEPKEATYPLHGIPNTAQICWLSSSLQCLAHQDLVIEREKKDKLLGTVCAVVKVLQKKGTGIVDLNRLTDLMQSDRQMSVLDIGTEQDPAHFWRLLLQRMQERSRNASSVLSTEIIRTCESCDHVTEAHDQFHVLPLAVPASGWPSIHSQFRLFFTREVIQGRCSNCHMMSQIAIDTNLASQPDYIHIQLNRFENREGREKRKTRMFINSLVLVIGDLGLHSPNFLANTKFTCNYFLKKVLGEMGTGFTFDILIFEDDAVLIHNDGTIVTCDDRSARLSRNEKLAREDFESSVVLLHYSLLHYSKMNVENVFRFLSKCEPVTLLRQHKDYPILAADIDCLMPKKWLNDKIINSYLKLLVEDAAVPVVFLDSYFYQRLLDKKNVDKYFQSKTRHADIVLIPVCSKEHWSLNVAVISERTLKVYDSTRIHTEESRHIQKFLTKISRAEWRIQIMKNLPEQLSGTDCGVHALQLARSYLYEEPYNMDEADVGNIRTRMAVELCTGKLNFTYSWS